MKHMELHDHYLRHLVHDNVMNIVYCMIYDEVDNIFTKPLLEVIFMKLQAPRNYNYGGMYISNLTS